MVASPVSWCYISPWKCLKTAKEAKSFEYKKCLETGKQQNPCHTFHIQGNQQKQKYSLSMKSVWKQEEQQNNNFKGIFQFPDNFECIETGIFVMQKPWLTERPFRCLDVPWLVITVLWHFSRLNTQYLCLASFNYGYLMKKKTFFFSYQTFIKVSTIGNIARGTTDPGYCLFN